MIKSRKANRYKLYDYSTPGYYFVTICVENMNCVLEKVENEKVILNLLGDLVERFWKNIPKIYGLIEIDEFIIMPNHIHGIIIINVGDANLASQNIINGNAKFAFPTNSDDRTKMLLSKVIQQFKRVCTIEIRKTNLKNFKWQKSFYDRIIRNENELYNIRKYIKYNTLKWKIPNFN
ncbi:MAG: transposase [Ignavibacteriae bacterium]|nr:transposase [Ignavibacteriota bacterium]